jgi:hypothetical protein
MIDGELTFAAVEQIPMFPVLNPYSNTRCNCLQPRRLICKASYVRTKQPNTSTNSCGIRKEKLQDHFEILFRDFQISAMACTWECVPLDLWYV